MKIYIIETKPGQISIMTEKQFNKLDVELSNFGGITWDVIIYADQVREIKIFNSIFNLTNQ